MKEIICGAGGFVGTNLRKHFEGQDKEVVVLPTERLLDVPGMHIFLKEHQPYHLYYLAAYGNLHGQEDIQETYRAIIVKFLNLLEATKGTEAEAIVAAGTTSEYGNKTEPMREDMLLEPETFYAAAKAGATHLLQVWAKRYDVPAVVFRPASITGVGEQSIHLIPTLIRSCLLKEPIPFVGEPVHDYINVLDVCTALETLAEHAKDHKGEIFNVGTGVQTSNLHVKEMVEELTGQRATVNHAVKLNPLNLSQVWMTDNTKIQALGWRPKYTLYQTLKEMVRSI